MVQARLWAILWRLVEAKRHGTARAWQLNAGECQVSALARVGCAAIMTASKMHVGHLESAAGAVGLVKVPQLPSANLLDCCSVKGLRCLNALFALQAVLLCENSLVPSFNIHGGLNPQVLAAMEGSCLKKPGALRKPGNV